MDPANGDNNRPQVRQVGMEFSFTPDHIVVTVNGMPYHLAPPQSVALAMEAQTWLMKLLVGRTFLPQIWRPGG